MNNLSLRRASSSLAQLHFVIDAFFCLIKKSQSNLFLKSISANKFKLLLASIVYLFFMSLPLVANANHYLNDSLILRKGNQQKINLSNNSLSKKQNNNLGKDIEKDVVLKDKIKQTLKENAQTLRFMENKGQLANKDILCYFNENK